MSDAPRRPPADEAPRSPKGTHDVLPPESARWEALIALYATLAERSGFGLAHTPIFEEARVFRRGIGEDSEIVGKEMYEFEDRSGRRLALRPEGTASIVRAFVQHRPPVPWRVWYFTPAFRYEQPQAGRNRQHHQVGVEVLGTDDPDIDVEVIALANDFYAALGLRAVTLKINSMGDAACRPGYLDALRSHLAAHAADLCGEHAARWEQNPLRVLDCKKPACQAATEAAPALTDHLCQPCAEHFARVVDGLDAAGIAWTLHRRLVRGFDYYTRTIFEFAASLDSANDAIGGGGRYDGLVELLGGPPTSGIGFGSGVERLLLACDAEGALQIPEQAADVFVVDVTGGAAARDLVLALRRSGVRAERSYDARSMKAQLKAADRSGAPVALIIGEAEAAAASVTIRDLRDGTQLTESRAAVLERTAATGRVLMEGR
jgi:histidyl-tRNA synthetase